MPRVAEGELSRGKVKWPVVGHTTRNLKAVLWPTFVRLSSHVGTAGTTQNVYLQLGSVERCFVFSFQDRLLTAVCDNMEDRM